MALTTRLRRRVPLGADGGGVASPLARAAAREDGDGAVPVAPPSAAAEDPDADPALRVGPVTRFMRRHPWWVDGTLAALYAAFSVTDYLVERDLGVVRPPSTLVLVAAFTVLLVLRRRAGVLGALAVAVAVPLHRLAVLGPVPDRLSEDLLAGTITVDVGTTAVSSYDLSTLALFLYAVAVYRTRRTTWLTLAATGAAVAASVLAFGDPRIVTAEIGGSAAVLLVAVLIGLQIRARRQRLFQLEERASQLALERDQREQIAVSAERARIAREMHDVVAHSLAVMITLAEGASASLTRRPEQARLALDELAETGRRALGDTRRLVGVLREDAPAPVPAPGAEALAPQPGAHDVADLVERFRVTGLPVRLMESGPPLPPDAGLQLAMYRIVQECLTNVLRYARLAPRIDVTIVRTPRAVGIVVDNDAGSTGHAVVGGRKGLIGMRERAAVYGGTVEAGPTATGWCVRAQLRFDEETR
ncbi:sensor histidine kinase [Georgenia ruanii]|uniref:sensor histidine kinase n=1 Tax=Georgenia ruanii TaxID=348442 RepID=UPI00126524DA|nr:histidine kinase [Georgenia ruanii]